MFSTPSENASRVRANTQPAAFDNPLPAVREKPAADAPAFSGTFHTVEDGQTFYSISKLHHLTVKELLTLNHLKNIVTLSIGQKLIVAEQSPAGIPAPKQFFKEPVLLIHTVTAGETVFRISQNYHISVEDIQKQNNLTGYTIKVGQKLTLPQNENQIPK